MSRSSRRTAAAALITGCAWGAIGCAAQGPGAGMKPPNVECPGGAPLGLRTAKDRTQFWCKGPTEESFVIGEATSAGNVVTELRYRVEAGGGFAGTLYRFGSERVAVDFTGGEPSRCVIERPQSSKGGVVWEPLSEHLFRDGHVRSLRRYHDGALVEKAELDAEGRRDGLHEQYWPSGKVLVAERFLHGKPHGTTTRYREDGVKRLESEFADGAQHGPSTIWDASGTKRFTAIYERGLPNGPFFAWDASGRVTDEGSVAHGDGAFVDVDDEGRVTRRGTLHNGKWEGPFTDYYPSGARRVEGRLSFGKPNGPWVSYWENGHKKAQGRLLADAPIGVWDLFHDNGAVIYSGSMLGVSASAHPDGVWKRFNPDGSPAGEDIYASGILLRPPDANGLCRLHTFSIRATGEVMDTEQAAQCPGKQIAQ